MRRWRVRFAILVVVLAVPVGLLIARALESQAFEERARHDALAERVFDEMERALNGLLDTEEARPIASYTDADRPPARPYVVGHFEIDSDGRLRTPAQADAKSRIERAVGERLERDADDRRASVPFRDAPFEPGTTQRAIEQPAPAPQMQALEAQESKRTDAYDALQSFNRAAEQRKEKRRVEPRSVARSARELEGRAEAAAGMRLDLAEAEPGALGAAVPEATPMFGRALDARHLALFRTVLDSGRGYRQGVLLDVPELVDWLRDAALADGELADYAELSFSNPFASGDARATPDRLVYRYRFAEPFDALGATLQLAPLPGLGAERFVYCLAALLIVAGGAALAFLYRTVSVALRFAQRRSNFAAAVSHELKTPLTAIRMYAEMLRDDMVGSEAKRREYYEAMTLESERLSRLIQNVLEFSRLERGASDATPVVGSPADSIADAARLLAPHAAKAGFELVVDVEPELPPVRFEPDALVQILFNLVENALKYAVDAESRRIELSCRATPDGVELCVADHGPGVPERQRALIFEPFYRGEDELTRRTQGTGIGLALVHALAQQMGGRVWASASEPRGLAIHLALARAT